MLPLKSFLLLLFLVPSMNSSLLILIDSFSGCETNKKLPLQVSNLSAYNRRGKSYVSANLVITETLKGPLEQEVILERCDMQKTKCMSAPKIYTPDQCPKMNESYFAYNFFGKMSPPISKCPFMPGTHVLENSMVDHSRLVNSPFLAGKYKAKVYWYNKKGGVRRKLMCVMITAKFFDASNRKPTRN